ncbi:MAG: hypothetical protein DMD95_03815 [Candidatus Rokuibacteriota bacterium]|nr:MAG: hypothetical protein DMD95_03815 [Candidatus Rokubacteria bacterium]
MQSLQVRGTAEGLERQAEASLHALRETMRQAPTLSTTTKHQREQIRFLSYHVLPLHLQVGDRFSDETGEWEIASRPYSTAGGKRSTLAFGELISPPRCGIGRGALTSASG